MPRRNLPFLQGTNLPRNATAGKRTLPKPLREEGSPVGISLLLVNSSIATSPEENTARGSETQSKTDNRSVLRTEESQASSTPADTATRLQKGSFSVKSGAGCCVVGRCQKPAATLKTKTP